MERKADRRWNGRLVSCVREALPAAGRTSLWLLKIMLPVSLLVTLLSYYDILPALAALAEPLFTLIGLPGSAALVFITSIFTNIYTVVALLANLDFSLREGIIIAVMCLISHGFIVETVVLKKTGSSGVGMVLLRIGCSFAAALCLHWILPETGQRMLSENLQEVVTLGEALKQWAVSSLWLCLQIVLIVSLLMMVQRILEEFGVLRALSRLFSPVMRLMGLPASVSFLWIVGNTVGLAYGAAIMMDYAAAGQLSRRDADLLNHHLAVSHSQLEDPLLFLVLGLPMGWLILSRVALAIGVVWFRRGWYAWRDSRNMIPM